MCEDRMRNGAAVAKRAHATCTCRLWQSTKLRGQSSTSAL